ncbi:hypothetical protein [Halobacillus litoralis]|uniref:Uncharacterized protein n=1 Tax=Halobacillus litoralis TaxID=45668 RepID=A0A410MDM9_9BACI|nr:hypothetical protein [Halobacillus litoralis]QAS52810.1 hypothetical protein HLI_11690 [Halobacillus litoralis]
MNNAGVTVHEDNIVEFQKVIEELGRYRIEVGIFAEADSFYAMIANVHEYGMTIKAKKKFLTLPLPASEGRSASEIEGLFRPPGTQILATSENGELTPMFILKEQVKIPERSFIRASFDEKEGDWTSLMERLIDKVFAFEITVEQMYEQLGAEVAANIQAKIRSISSPENSSLTKKNKGSTSPLVDSGGLIQRITWKVVSS